MPTTTFEGLLMGPAPRHEIETVRNRDAPVRNLAPEGRARTPEETRLMRLLAS
jgi:hypothetical protein